MNPHLLSFQKEITTPFKFRFFMLTKLPAAFFAGLKIDALNDEKAVISLKQKWFNKNPFHSIYFAVLSMAAEVSTGILCMAAIYKRNPSISMLVVKSDAMFYKKATGKILFSCTDGIEVNKIIEIALATGEGQTITCHSIGSNEKNEIVATFNFTWSFKAKKHSE